MVVEIKICLMTGGVGIQRNVGQRIASHRTVLLASAAPLLLGILSLEPFGGKRFIYLPPSSACRSPHLVTQTVPYIT